MAAMARKLLISAAVVAMSFAAVAASRIRLIYGKGWNRASEDVKKMMESPAFKTACKGKYVTEFVDWHDYKAPEGNLGSLKVPCIFVIDEKNHCYFVFENVPYNYSAEKLIKAISRVDEMRKKIEAGGINTPDQCGKLLMAMEKFVGGPKRVISQGFYADVFDKLVQLDPGDKEGWQRHFLLDDGIDLVIKANEYREKKDLAGGKAFIDAEKAKPRQHLNRDQQQAVLMAEFALYREDPSRKEESINKLKTVAAVNENTFWGTCALGWLNWLGQPPLSTYWGWHHGDFKGPQLNATVTYGVSYSFRRPGDYEIRFEPKEGNVNVTSVTLYAGNEEVASLKKTPFEFRVEREYAGRIDKMVVKGTAASDSEGDIIIHRRVLKPRKTK